MLVHCVFFPYFSPAIDLFCFPNTDHVTVPRRRYLLLKLDIFMLACGLFNDQNKVQTSFVSSHDLYWENKIDKLKSSDNHFGDFVIIKKKLTSVSYASVLLLVINCVIDNVKISCEKHEPQESNFQSHLDDGMTQFIINRPIQKLTFIS